MKVGIVIKAIIFAAIIGPWIFIGLSLEDKRKKEEIVPPSKVQPNKRAEAIDKFFAVKKAPMAGYGKVMVDAVDNKVDWRLLPAIAWLESHGGKSPVAQKYNNPFGIGDPNFRQFENLSEAIIFAGKMVSGKKSRIYTPNMNLDKLLLKYNSENPNYRRHVYRIMASLG